MPQILLVTGYARAGKDTFANAIKAQSTTPFATERFSAPVKDAANQAFRSLGIDLDLHEDAVKEVDVYRNMLLAIGNAAVKADVGCMARVVAKKVEAHVRAGYHVIVPDWRRTSEAKVLLQHLEDNGLADLVRVRPVCVQRYGLMASSPWEQDNVDAILKWSHPGMGKMHVVEADDGDLEGLFAEASFAALHWSLRQ